MSKPTYDIEWSRPPYFEILTCHNLPARKLVRRLISAVKNYGEVRIIAVRRSPTDEPL